MSRDVRLYLEDIVTIDDGIFCDLIENKVPELLIQMRGVLAAEFPPDR